MTTISKIFESMTFILPNLNDQSLEVSKTQLQRRLKLKNLAVKGLTLYVIGHKKKYNLLK